MKYLILGSSGQIGSHLVEYIKQKNNSVILFDIENSPKEDLRITNNEYLEKCIIECNFVFFLAWDVGGSRYLSKLQDTFNFLQNNLKIMTNVFGMIDRYKKPFIFTSTQMSNLSNSGYGLTKALGEKITLSLRGLNVRLWNVYGYETNPEKSHVITDFIKQAKYNKAIKMLTDGTEERQFLYAEDCSECLYKMSLKYDNLDKGHSYHLSSFKWTSIKDVAMIIKNIFQDTTIETAKEKDKVQFNSKIEPDKKILNFWKPSTSLEDGIKKLSKKF
jgi:nucleoside-diphosphate-sugar epimerase